jgi:hypothetical protein
MSVITRNQLKNSINNVPVVNLVKDVIPIRECAKGKTILDKISKLTIDIRTALAPVVNLVNYLSKYSNDKINLDKKNKFVSDIKNGLDEISRMEGNQQKLNQLTKIHNIVTTYRTNLIEGFNLTYLPGGITVGNDGVPTRKCAKNISYKKFFDDEEIIINVCNPHFKRENGKVKVTHKWTKANANEIGDSEYVPEDEDNQEE